MRIRGIGWYAGHLVRFSKMENSAMRIRASHEVAEVRRIFDSGGESAFSKILLAKF